MQLAEQPDRDREAVSYTLEAVLHGEDVGADFSRIIHLGSGRRLAGLEAEQLTHIVFVPSMRELSTASSRK